MSEPTEMSTNQQEKTCIRGGRIDNLYDREIAEKAEVDLLAEIARQGYDRFSLAWLMVDRQWQIVAFADRRHAGGLT
jgi:hypothetical protein